MNAAIILAIGFICMACFLLGAKVGQTVAKGEEVKLPTVKPVKEVPVQPQQEDKKSRLDIIMQNIDNYDGTEQGQVDVPWR